MVLPEAEVCSSLRGGYRVQPLNDAHLPEWRRAYAQLDDRCIYAAPDYIALLARHYTEEAELFLYSEGNRFIYFPYFKRPLGELVLLPESSARLRNRYDAHSSWYYGGPYGAGAVDRDMADRFRVAFDAHATAAGCVCAFIRLDPDTGNAAFFADGSTVVDRPTVYVNLRQEWKTVWAGFHESNRRAVKKAERSGLSTRVCTAADDDAWEAFSEIYVSEMQRKSAPMHLRFPPRFFADLRRSLADHSVLIGAIQAETFVGGFVILFDDRRAFHFLSAGAPAVWHQRVNNLLFTEAIRWAHDNGKKIFDFMGGRPGVFNFKALFSRSRGDFCVRRKVYDQKLYDALTAAAGTDLEGRAFFPAYRAP